LVRRPGQLRSRPTNLAPERPGENKGENEQTDHDLDASAARFSALGDELAGPDDAARRALPLAPRSACEQEPYGYALLDIEIAVALSRGLDVESLRDVTFDALVDLERERLLRRKGQRLPHLHETGHDRGIRVVEPLVERLLRAHTRLRLRHSHETEDENAEYNDEN